MALTITHATVASDPQSPLLDENDWNANHVVTGTVDIADVNGLQTALDAKVDKTTTVNGQALSGNVTVTTITGNAGTATALQTPRNIGGVAFDGTADIVPQTIQMVNDAADTTCFVVFGNTSGSVSQQPKTNTGFTYNAATNAVAATTFTGALSGNATTATTLQNARTIGGVSFNGSANIVPQTIQMVNDAADTTCFIMFGNASGSVSQQPKTNTGLTYNAATNNVGATTFTGALSGNATTATTLQTARTINGTSFNGSANIVLAPRVGTTASSATPTPDADNNDIYTVTALATGATFGAPTGTPVNGQALVIRVKDNGTAQTLAYNAIYRAIGVTLPTTTVISKTLYLGMIYNSADTKWDVTGVAQEA